VRNKKGYKNIQDLGLKGIKECDLEPSLLQDVQALRQVVVAIILVNYSSMPLTWTWSCYFETTPVKTLIL